jgi:hypothetical protein
VRAYEPNLGSREGGAAPDAEDSSNSAQRNATIGVARPRL